MSKFVVTYVTGEEIEVEADSFDVEEDGRLVFSEEVDDFLPEEWTAIRDEVVEDGRRRGTRPPKIWSIVWKRPLQMMPLCWRLSTCCGHAMEAAE